MPFDINEFMRRVRAANPHYERFKSSSLHTLVDVLKRPPIPDINSVQRELAHLPAESLTKYSSALEYMKNTVQGLKSDDQKAHRDGSLRGTQALPKIPNGIFFSPWCSCRPSIPCESSCPSRRPPKMALPRVLN